MQIVTLLLLLSIICAGCHKRSHGYKLLDDIKFTFANADEKDTINLYTGNKWKI